MQLSSAHLGRAAARPLPLLRLQQQRLLPLVAPAAARPHRSSRVLLLVTQAAKSKGFGAGGSSKPAKKPQQRDDSRKAGGRRGVDTAQQQGQASRLPPPSGLDASLQQYDGLEEAKKRAEEEAEFQERLELIKAEAAQKRAAGAIPSPSSSGSSTPTRAAFDGGGDPLSPAGAPEEDIYANPPSLLSTLQDQLQSDIKDPALRQAKIGPGQLGLAGGALLFGLVFLLVSGGDFATTNRYKGVRPTRPPPDPIELSRLEQQAEGFEAALQANPDDLAALESAAVTYARMQNYGRAAELLDGLTAARPDDVEAWRLLGESRLLSVEPAKSVAAYEKAIALQPTDQSLITGLVDAYVANSQQAKAVAFLTDLRDKMLATAAASSSSTTSSSSSENAAATAAALPDSADDPAAASSSSSSSSSGVLVDPVGVQLLLGKSYAAWRGHDADALAAYDTLVRAFPTDFRGYLAKGLFLRDRGRAGDAERMFLQAKYYAPESMAGFVAARSGERGAVEPLPDNGLE